MDEENISDRLRALQSAMDFAAFGSAASAPRKLKPSILEVMNGTGGLNQGVPVRKSGTEEAGGFASYPAKSRPEELDAEVAAGRLGHGKMRKKLMIIDGTRRQVVSSETWARHHDAVRDREKELTQAHDELAAERRRSPWTKVEQTYRFSGSEGAATLAELFQSRKQLIVYHHMLQPADPNPCAGCCMVADQIPHLAHLNARNTTLVFVSKAPIAEIDSLQLRMGWALPWYETIDGFNADFGVNDGFGLNVFYRDGRDIYRTYFTTGRGVETLGTVWTLLDLTPLGRQETWEVAPAGTLQTEPYRWWRRHDEYDVASGSE